ncbi:MAG: tetratricopeptide repeat protein, partial [Planctomycetota bacterium]
LLGLVSDRLPEARLLLGRLALEMGEYSTAADLLMEAAAPMALADLGLARMLAGDGPGAVSALGKAAKMREESPERRKNDDAVIFARYSYALNATGDTNGARLAIRTAVAADRNHAELLLWRGLAELERGQPQTALDDIGRLVKNEPTMWRAWLIAGKCYLALDKKDEAAAALKKASDLVPPEAREREEITRLMRQ